MKVIALISGGKDSTFNMMECIRHGHEIVALVNLRPPNSLSIQNETHSANSHDDICQELDSYMYQSVGNELIELYAQAAELPLYRATITGKVLNQNLDYEPTESGDEVEDLYRCIQHCKQEMELKHGYTIEAVSSGAILSTYQKNRVENICTRLGMKSLAYLWSRNQSELLDEMIAQGIHAILIKVACMGLTPEKHLAQTLSQMRPHLKELEAKYGANVCGEGGEYETLTLDCPLFKKKKISILETQMKIHSNDAFAQVGYLLFKEFCLIDK